MQVPSEGDIAGLLERIVEEGMPRRRGVEAWRALLAAYASLMRQLQVDLEAETGLSLTDFDVLAQLAGANGALRMTELARRVFGSRSGLTRRVASLEERGLVHRASSDSDARGVDVALTDAGIAALSAAAPVHIRGIGRLFVDPLTDDELASLESALSKVVVDCSFG